MISLVAIPQILAEPVLKVEFLVSCRCYNLVVMLCCLFRLERHTTDGGEIIYAS